jgi:hypothetical protein
MKKFECDIKANNKEWLFREYVENKRSLRDIAKECSVSDDTIRTRLNRFNIIIRSPKESNCLGYTKNINKIISKKVISKNLSQKNGSIIACLNCEKPIYTPKKLLETKKFCSISCRDIYWREHVNRNQDWRDYPEYDIWRKNVYKRDFWKCKICNNKRKINAHHILDGNSYENLRFDINNGIVLCEKHHIQLHINPSSFIQECIKQTPNIGGNLEIDNPETLITEFLYSFIRSNDYQGESRTDYGIVWSANII